MKKSNRALLRLPFDQYQRYKITEELINLLRFKKKMDILDVGGGKGLLGGFLPNDRVYTLDLNPGKGSRFINASALKMPFCRKRFDVVVSIDALEHICPADRQKFLREQLRVSRKINIISAPCRTPEAELAERVVYEFIRAKYNIKYDILQEHFQNKLPDLDDTLVFLRRQGAEYIWVNNGYIFHWLFMMLLNFHLEWMSPAETILPKINEFYNRYFYRNDNKAPAYRKVVVASQDKAVNLQAIVEAYRADGEELPAQPHKLELANLLMRAIEIDELRKKDGELRQLKADLRQQEKDGRQRAAADKKQAAAELERTAKAGSREAARLNKEIESLHKTYSRKLVDADTERKSEKAQLNAEILRLNDEIKKLHGSYSLQADKLAQEKEKAGQSFSAEAARLNKEIESLHRSYSEKLKEAETERKQEKLSLSQEIARLNDEIKKLHSSYAAQIERLAQEKDKSGQSLSKEIDRLNKEIESLHKAYSGKLKEAESERAKDKELFAAETTRLNDEIKKLHLSYSGSIDKLVQEKNAFSQSSAKEIDRLNKEIESLHKAYSGKLKEAESERAKEKGLFSAEITRLNDEIKKLHASYSLEIERLNKEIRELHQSYAQKTKSY